MATPQSSGKGKGVASVLSLTEPGLPLEGPSEATSSICTSVREPWPLAPSTHTSGSRVGLVAQGSTTGTLGWAGL